MPARKVTPQEKKAKGTFNVTRDKDEDFRVIDGLLQFTPNPPQGYTEKQLDLWNRAWRHLVKHGYGKEIDIELVETLVHEWSQYVKYREFDHTAHLAEKSLKNYLAASNALCLNPNALGKAAILQKKEKGGKLKDLLNAKTA